MMINNYNKHLQFRGYKLNKDFLDTDSLNWGDWLTNCRKNQMIDKDELISTDSSRAANKRFLQKVKKIINQFDGVFNNLGLND